MTTTFEEDRAKGEAAFRAGLPLMPGQSPGWEIGYGDAVTIKPADPPDDDPD